MTEWPSVQLRRVTHFAYGESLADEVRVPGAVPVYGSNGPVGEHDRPNTDGPVLVIGRKGSFGKVQYSAAPVFAIDTTFFVDRNQTNADLRWLYYALDTIRLDSLSEDVGVPGLSRERAYAQRVPLPPLKVQYAIADYLDAETARIDALTVKKRRMIELLNARWRSEAIRRLADLIAARGSLPLRRVVQCLDGRRVPLSSEERSYRRGPYPYYGASGIVDRVDEYLFDEDLVLVGEDGAQLGVPGYPISQRVSGKIWVNNHAHVLRPVNVDQDLLVFHLNTFDRVPFMSGATRDKITQEDLGRIPFPAASMDEQRSVGLALVRLRSLSEDTIGCLDAQLQRLAEHRQALITAAITGELEIPGVAA